VSLACRLLSVVGVTIAMTTACSSGSDVSDVGTADAVTLGEPVAAADVEPLAVEGTGRALQAARGDDGRLVVVTTAGIHVREPGSAAVASVVTFRPGEAPVLIALSSNGENAAVLAGDPQRIQVYATSSGAATRSFHPPAGVVVRDAWFLPDGETLVADTSVGPIVIDTGGNVMFDPISSPLPTGRLAALPDGSVVGAVVGSADLAVIGESGAVERHPIELREGERLEDVRVAPDGQLIGVSVSSGDEFEQQHRVVVLDAALTPVGSIDIGERVDWVLTDDALIAAVDTEVKAWSVDGNTRGRVETKNAVVKLHADGNDVVIVGQQGSIDRWDGASTLVSLAEGGVATVFQSVDADAGSIATVDLYGDVDIRSVVDGRSLISEESFAAGELTSLAVASDGSTVATGSTSGAVRVLDADLVRRHQFAAAEYGSAVGAVAFDAQSGELVTGLAERVGSGAFDDGVSGWTSEFTERFQTVGDSEDVPGCAYFNARIRFDPFGSTFVTASHDFTVGVLDRASGELVDELPGSTTIVDLGFSPDGSVLVVAHDDGIVDVWDAAERSVVGRYRLSQPGVSAIAVLPDVDQMLIADLTGALSLVDVMTGETVRVLDGTIDRTSALALTHDGTLAAAPKPDGTIGFWSTDSGAELAVAAGHTGTVTALAFAPDDTRLYSASDDGTVRSWSVAVGP
jgi:WD40 repeat protein